MPVEGVRLGFDADAHWKRGRFALDTEWLTFDFEDADAGLTGGYVQGSWWLTGSEAAGGIQPVLRAELAELSGDALAGIDGERMTAVTLGANVWWNGWTRWQINVIGEHVDGPGNGPFDDDGWRPTVLNQLQIKF